jgi:exoribonuclease-2
MQSWGKWSGSIVEYFDRGRFHAGLVIREHDRHVAILDPNGQERLIARNLVMVQHPERRPARDQAAAALATLEAERAALAKELDLNLLWEVTQEQGRSFSASELAELFFGTRAATATSVMLEALLNDRLFFVRRHLEFVARPAEQVERLRLQQDRIRGRSEGTRRAQALLRSALSGATPPRSPESAALAGELSDYLRNPLTRTRELTRLLTSVAPEVDPAEAAFEILEHLGAPPAAPRFALIGGLPSEFSEATRAEAAAIVPAARALAEAGVVITIDDDDTVEIDDGLSCAALPHGGLRVRVHIALVGDFVAKGGAVDREAAARATTVYLPETTIHMLPEVICCERASLVQGATRPVLTTDLNISAAGEIETASIYPSCIRVTRRLDYAAADRMLDTGAGDPEVVHSLRLLKEMADRLRQRRQMAGAIVVHRREPKVTVRGNDIQVRVLDSQSPARALVAEYMVLSNFVAARFAAEHRIPIIFRVQPEAHGEPQRPRLSLYPEYHVGVGLDFYAQFSSPIRRYADLVLQRQLLAWLSAERVQAYSVEELLTVLAGAEGAETSARELERRAKRYWILRYLQRHSLDAPLRAVTRREGATAELVDYAIRGSLRAAPNLPDQTPILVQINRLDPLRGQLALDYLRPCERLSE